MPIAIELTHPRTKAYNIQTHNRTCTKMPTCFEHPLTSDSFHVALFTLRPIFGKRSCLIAPLHILYVSPFLPTDFIDCMCVSRNSFFFLHRRIFFPSSVVSLLLFLLLLLLLLILFVCLLFFFAFSRFIFYWPIDFHFCFAIYYDLILNLVHFTSIFSIAIRAFFCSSLLQFNFFENVNLFLQYHHDYTVLWFSHCQRTEFTLTNFVSLSSML